MPSSVKNNLKHFQKVSFFGTMIHTTDMHEKSCSYLSINSIFITGALKLFEHCQNITTIFFLRQKNHYRLPPCNQTVVI